MNKVYSLEQAEQWFRNNASGKVTCVKDGEEKNCESFNEAKAFYITEVSNVPSRTDDDDDSSSVGLGLLAGAVMGDMASSIESSDPDPVSTPDPEPSQFDSGGGDFGGAGAGSDY